MASTRRNLFLLAALSLFVSTTVTAFAQGAGIGAKYGSREPLPCPTAKTSTLSLDSARKLFQCGNEVETGYYLYLIQDLKMEMGAPRKSISSDSYRDIDPNAPVYPVRGNFTRYQCSKLFNIDAAHTNVGSNCNAQPQPHAEGICYRTTFGDWSCKMFDRVTDSSQTRMHVPPPGN